MIPAPRPGNRLRWAVLSRTLYLVAQGGSSLLIFVLFSRTLGQGQLDAVATGMATLVTVQAVSDLGLSLIATSEIPQQAATNPAAAEPLRVAIARLYLGAAVVALLLTAASALVVPGDAQAVVLIAAPAAAASVLVSGAESLARADRDNVRPLQLILSARGAFFLAAPLLLLDPDAFGAMAILSGSLVIGSIPAFRAVRTQSRGGPTAPLSPLMKRAAVVGGAGALIAVGTRGNVLILANLAERGEVGAYEAAWRIFQVFVYGAGAVATATTPYAAGALSTHGRGGLWRTTAPAFAVLAVAAVILMAVLLLAAEPLVRGLYATNVQSTAASLRVLAVALPLTFIAYPLQTAIFIPLGRYRSLIAASAALFGVAATLTYALVERHGAVGCAYAMVAGQAALIAVLLTSLRWPGMSNRAASMTTADENGTHGRGQNT